MYWLQNPPWARWILAATLIAAAAWIELMPETTAEHPFAAVDIGRGEEIGVHNTEVRSVPAGLLEPVALPSRAGRRIAAGSPILDGDFDEAIEVPDTWWIVEADVPARAASGTSVRVVLLDTGEVVEGFVASEPDTDPFGNGSGSIAVPPDRAAEVAVASAEGRIAILVSSG